MCMYRLQCGHCSGIRALGLLSLPAFLGEFKQKQNKNKHKTTIPKRIQMAVSQDFERPLLKLLLATGGKIQAGRAPPGALEKCTRKCLEKGEVTLPSSRG